MRRAGAVAAGIVAVTAGWVVASSGAARVESCASRQLHLRASFYGEAGGQFTQTFTVTNGGATPCRLAGWPTVRVQKGSGRSAAARSIRVVQGDRSSRPFRPVILGPGGAGSFDVFGADWNALTDRACPKTHALLIALPGVAPIPVVATLPYCSPFFIAPLVAGKADRDAWSSVWARRWCRMEQFAVAIGPRISEATGQHTLALRLVNHGSSCTLFGTPALWFEDAHGQIPFRVRTGRDQMIAATYALTVQVRRGGSAWVVMNHYRCDLGDKRAAGVIRIGLAGAVYANTVRVAIRNPYQRVAYCGPGDPGSTVTVAPFEPTLAAAFRR